MSKLGRSLLFGLGGLSAAAAVGPFLVPVKPLEGTVPPQDLADPDSRFAEIEGVKTHYKVDGPDNGEPALVLLHGFAASTFSWHQVMGPLSATRKVVALDRPAFGLSERPLHWHGRNPYSPESQVRITTSLMDRLGIDRAVLVGHSAGGSVAMLTALQRPERVRALVLIDAAVYVGGGAPDWVKPLLATPQMRRLGPLFVRKIRDLGPRIINTAWHDPSRITDGILEGYRKPLQVENWDRGLWEMTLASGSMHLAERVRDVHMPVLVITGDDDRIVPTAHSVRLASELPDARLAVIASSGHLPHEERPDNFLREVKAFLGELEQTGNTS